MKRRNKFSLSHFKLLTGKMGYLYPISCVETLPGDTFQMATSVFLRFSPMVAPVMTPVTVKIHHWFVPTRLLWDDFEDFITGGPDGMSVPEPPYKLYGRGIAGLPELLPSSLLCYLGVPTGSPPINIKISALPLRAYNLIWNEWYRDQNTQDPLTTRTSSGYEGWNNNSVTPPVPVENYELLRSPWDKDYFTTASPWEQKGAAINVPVNGIPSGTLQITGNGSPTFFNDLDTTPAPLRRAVSAQTDGEGSNDGYAMGSTVYQGDLTNYGAIGTPTYPLKWANPALTATFAGDASLGNININQFREAMALQRFEEHRAIYGSRYTEYLRYLGVRASDGRLQRPEYLGGGRSVIQFSEVLQTAEGTDPVGTMRGHGIGAMRTNRFRRFFEEHGYVISLLSIRPKSIYMQGLPRMFSRELKTDYWQKELEHVGQQEVKNKELYAFGNAPNDTFGYSDRYNEYRSHPSYVCGEFRDLLNYWHLARDFSDQPVLNSDFISSLPSDRIFADQTGNDTIYMMVNNSIQARRLVSKRGNPI